VVTTSIRTWKIAALVIILAAVMVVTSVSLVSLAATAPGTGSAAPGLSESSASANVSVGAFSSATAISSAFWGVNVEPTQRFTSSDADSVAATPVTYVRFPGGQLGEEFNYTSGVVTSTTGAQTTSLTSTASFVTNCKLFGCKAIMQLPAEIDHPATAAYYASYVVHTLGYQPAYWEFGNDPSGWTHYGQPWSDWKTRSGNITPLPFANLVQTYITAVLKVDSAAKFIALGAGMGGKNYAEAWVKELASVDGHQLSGISVHSYIIGGPSKPTDAQLFANLNGKYSLTSQVTADRAYIKAACPTCTDLDVFVSEINAAEDGGYVNLLTSFAGPLYLAAETTQGLANHVSNLDWFCYDCTFNGAWSQKPAQWQMQYYLFSDVMTQLKTKTLTTTVKGPDTFYGMATYDSTGLSLLLVNVGSSSVSAGLSQSGFILNRAGVTELSWQSGASQPTKSSVTLKSALTVPGMSIILLTVGSAGAKSPSGSSVTPALALDTGAGAGSPIAVPAGGEGPIMLRELSR
jgi:hypothetical protein